MSRANKGSQQNTACVHDVHEEKAPRAAVRRRPPHRCTMFNVLLREYKVGPEAVVPVLFGRWYVSVGMDAEGLRVGEAELPADERRMQRVLVRRRLR